MLRKQYLISQSPLYKITTKKRLCALLKTSISDLDALLSRTDNYITFPKLVKNKIRTIEQPKTHLQHFHELLFRFLQKITPPDYLHSGVKGRSILTNVKPHLGNFPLVKVDIANFYPSTRFGHVYSFFFYILHCSPDVATILAKLCIKDDHIPTGSCLSQLLAFFSHYKLFSIINSYCIDKHLRFTCYVDDLTISGVGVNQGVQKKIIKMIRRRGLEVKKNKVRLYSSNEPKLVTGIIILGNKIKLPNYRHKKIHETLLDFESAVLPIDRKVLFESINGMIISASQLDRSMNRFLPMINHTSFVN